MKRLILLCIVWLAASVGITSQEIPAERGTIDLPYQYGDGGIVAMQAGEIVTVTWVDAPPDAAAYMFVWKSLFWNKPWFIMGMDGADEDGVSIPWKVKSRVDGTPYGIAFYPDRTFILSEISTLEYVSGKAPPEGICSASYSGGDGLMVMDSVAPVGEARFLGFLADYVRVVEQVTYTDGTAWLKIEITSPEVLDNPKDALPEFGWIPAEYVRLHGDCGFLN